MRLTKAILSLCICAFLIATLLVGTQADTRLSRMTSLTSGDVVLAMEGIVPTDKPKQTVYLKTKEAAVSGLDWGTFQNAQPSDGVWHLEVLSNNTCTLQVKSLGDKGYVNMGAGTVSLGAKATLNYSFDGNLKLYVVVGGSTYYLRFTNLDNTPRLHAGTGTASNAWVVYKSVEVRNMPTSDAADSALPSSKPLYTIACLADTHCDYGLQSTSPYLRQSVITVANDVKKNENANIVLVGGDMTSDNAKLASSGGWSPAIYANVINAYDQYTSQMTKSHYTLYCAGNHEYQAGNANGYDSYQGFVDLMTKNCGKPISSYLQKHDTSLTSDGYPNYVLGLRYQLDGFDYIIINAPRGKTDQYSSGTYTWLSQQLKAIGKSKTVFIIGHYPLCDDKGSNNNGLKSTQYTSFINTVKDYPNVIYLNGHIHGESDVCFIRNDTFERINYYTYEGDVVTNRKAVPIGFLSCYMGTEAYYKYPWQTNWLGAENPDVIQALFLYIYRDRIVFQMKNYGTSYATGSYTISKNLKPWTVMRDMSSYFKTESTDTSTNTKTSSSSATVTEPQTTDTVTDVKPTEQPTNTEPTEIQKTETTAPVLSSTQTVTATEEKGANNLLWILIAAGVVLAALIVTVLILVLKKKK